MITPPDGMYITKAMRRRLFTNQQAHILRDENKFDMSCEALDSQPKAILQLNELS